MPQIDVPLVRGRFGATSRPDTWWVQPLVVFLGFQRLHRVLHMGSFSREKLLVRAVYFAHVFARAFRIRPHAWFGGPPAWFPSFLPFSAAFLILWAPGGFRFTCYYYRGAYYKALGGSAQLRRRRATQEVSGVSAPSRSILQNIHRYFMYLAVIFIVLLAKDAYDGFLVGPMAFTSTSVRWCSLINVILLAATRSAAIRCAIWSAASATFSRNLPFARRPTTA